MIPHIPVENDEQRTRRSEQRTGRRGQRAGKWRTPPQREGTHDAPPAADDAGAYIVNRPARRPHPVPIVEVGTQVTDGAGRVGIIRDAMDRDGTLAYEVEFAPQERQIIHACELKGVQI